MTIDPAPDLKGSSEPKTPKQLPKRRLLRRLGGGLLALLLFITCGAGLYAESYFRSLRDPFSQTPLFFVDHWRSQPTPRPYVVEGQKFAIPRNMVYPVWLSRPPGHVDMLLFDVVWPDLKGWSLDTWPRFMNESVDADGKRRSLDTPKQLINIVLERASSYGRPERIAAYIRALEGLGVCRDGELPGWRICPLNKRSDWLSVSTDLYLYNPSRGDLLGSGIICKAYLHEPEDGTSTPHCRPSIQLTDDLHAKISFDRRRLNEAESIIAKVSDLICGFYLGPADGAPKPPCPQESSRIQL